MPYRCQAKSELAHNDDNLLGWEQADPDYLFFGTIDTDKLYVYIVPVNIFEGHGNLNQETLNNINHSAINRYASGAPGVREKIRTDFQSYEGVNWIASRPMGQTHHTSVALHYRADLESCLSFSPIKIASANFAQLKCTSASLNTKLGAEVHHSFARATALQGDAGEEFFLVRR